MLVNLLRKLSVSRHASALALAVAIPTFALLVAADSATSYEYSLSSFYLLIILAVGWFCGLPWAGLFAFLSMFAQVEIGRVTGYAIADPVSFYVSNGNKLFAYLLVALLVSSLRTLYHRENAMARIDYLTGVSNKLGFTEQLRLEIARHRRLRNAFAVAYIDCDNFKSVNDTRGHAAGDRVLQTIAATCRATLRTTDVVARLGGDEFAVILPSTGEFGALQTSHKLRRVLTSAMDENQWHVTFSIGVGIFVDVPESIEDVVAFSDSIMYQVKTGGKNKVLHRIYQSETAESAKPVRARAV